MKEITSSLIVRTVTQFSSIFFINFQLKAPMIPAAAEHIQSVDGTF